MSKFLHNDDKDDDNKDGAKAMVTPRVFSENSRAENQTANCVCRLTLYTVPLFPPRYSSIIHSLPGKTMLIKSLSSGKKHCGKSRKW